MATNSPSNTIYSPSQAAEMLSISVNSVRRYCGEFGVFLSPGACPPAGQHRQLTARDLFVLGVVSQRTQEGLSYQDIKHQLEAEEIPDVVSVGEEAEHPLAPFRPPSIQPLVESLDRIEQTLGRLAEGVSAQDATLQVLTNQQSEVADLRRRIDDMAAAQLSQAEERRQIARMITSLHIFLGALLIILLLTIAVAAGWIG